MCATATIRASLGVVGKGENWFNRLDLGHRAAMIYCANEARFLFQVHDAAATDAYTGSLFMLVDKLRNGFSPLSATAEQAYHSKDL